jgi:hypothetical protein
VPHAWNVNSDASDDGELGSRETSREMGIRGRNRDFAASISVYRSAAGGIALGAGGVSLAGGGVGAARGAGGTAAGLGALALRRWGWPTSVSR